VSMLAIINGTAVPLMLVNGFTLAAFVRLSKRH
jgi:hypothetical protein